MTKDRKLSDELWLQILSYLLDLPTVYVGKEENCRRFIEGCFWILRTGAPWRDLPERYGLWNSIYTRWSRWSDKGTWADMFAHFSDDPDMESMMIDSTVVRAHPCAAGASQKKGGQDEQALGRSVGGFTTKVHVNVDALGNPLRIILTEGQRHDSTQAEALIQGYSSQYVMADKSYDSDDFIQVILDANAQAVIPPRSNRTEPREYDKHLYRERHLVECFINKLKQFRRVFSRFEKLGTRYLSFLHFASALIWLR